MDYDSSCCSEKYNNGEFYDPETKKQHKKSSYLVWQFFFP